MSKKEYTKLKIEDLIAEAISDFRDGNLLPEEDSISFYEDICSFDLPTLREVIEGFDNPDYLVEFSVMFRNGRNVEEDFLIIEIIKL